MSHWDDLKSGKYKVPDRPVQQFSQKQIAKMPASTSRDWVRIDDVTRWLMDQEVRQSQELLAHMIEEIEAESHH